ncbi:hypothetical protein BKA57DRAFT_129678 [Linnemannia elongata]|nr:hypothetical protein BKA57DRAFT_129678 [Linnemannia elongata]
MFLPFHSSLSIPTFALLFFYARSLLFLTSNLTLFLYHYPSLNIIPSLDIPSLDIPPPKGVNIGTPFSLSYTKGNSHLHYTSPVPCPS